jgi:8-oxo-dGTP diphosphatase
VAHRPGILARGPWEPGAIEVSWLQNEFQPTADATQAADAALEALRARGSPSHDGLAARLSDFDPTPAGLRLELQPARWALRLLPDDASGSLSILCVVRSADGSWLAGRRAAWLASWPERWALGAGGSVELGEHPAETMGRELREEWSVDAQDMRIEALVMLPSRVVLLVGQAWLPAGASVEPDHEHDEFAWWPPEVERWPAEADEPLRRMATLLSSAA